MEIRRIVEGIMTSRRARLRVSTVRQAGRDEPDRLQREPRSGECYPSLHHCGAAMITRGTGSDRHTARRSHR